MNAPHSSFAENYLKFTRIFSKVHVCEEDSKIRIPEKVLRCVWNDQALKKDQLCTTDAEPAEVIFPGYWNFGPGPDFKNATIKIDGNLFEGDLEIHVNSGDWQAHNHSSNPEFDNVIFHVFLWKTGKAPVSSRPSDIGPEQLRGGHIFEFELKNLLKKGILQLAEELDLESYPIMNQFNYGLCHEPLARLPFERLEQLLDAAGDARVVTKMGRFHDRVILRGYEQVFYEGLAEAMGYPNNKQSFRYLAENLPLTQIKELLPPRSSAELKRLHVSAMLFGFSGLIDFKGLDLKTLPTKDGEYFSSLQKLWKQYQFRLPATSLNADCWQFSGLRPANYPYRRIAGLASLLVRHLNGGIFADFITTLKKETQMSPQKGYAVKIPRKIYDYFSIGGEDYWNLHYTAGGKLLKKAQNLIGPTRSAEIILNIVLPIGLIYARAQRSAELEATFNKLYQSSKASGDNQLLRFIKYYILGNQKEMTALLVNDRKRQGLMQIYQDFCAQNGNNCNRCPFPNVVKKYFS